jgi:protein ImuA
MTSRTTIPLPLRANRVHEACGAGRVGFAVAAMALVRRTLWIRESWQGEALNPLGLADFCDPSQLLVAQTKDQTDMLAVAEEALRDGALPLVVLEITRPLNLREGRRLQLAAKAGKSIGLCLIPEGMGSNASETRWLCTPLFDPDDSTLMSWETIKNKSGTSGTWHVRWNAAARRFDVVCPAGKRPGSAGAAL